MIVEIDIEHGLDPSLHRRVNRQINFKLASVGAQVRVLTVNLGVTGVHGERFYACTMEARLQTGERKVAHTEGKQPNMCIADAAARLARSLRRDQLFNDARQAMR